MVRIVFVNYITNCFTRLNMDTYLVAMDKKCKEFIINGFDVSVGKWFTIGSYDSLEKANYVFKQLIDAEIRQMENESYIYYVPTNDSDDLLEAIYGK